MATLESPVGDKYYRHAQPVAAITWFVNHNLGRKVSACRVVDSGGNEWDVDLTDLSDNDCRLDFALPVDGVAHVS